MADKDDLEVLDAPVTVDDQIEVAPADAPEVKPAIIKPEEGLAELKAKLEASERGRQDAERRANEASSVAVRAQTNAQDSELNLVTNALAMVKQDTENLKAEYAAVMQDSNFVRAAEIQAEMASNAAKMLKLEDGKSAMEARPKPQAPQQQQVDPAEALARQLETNGSPKSARWIRDHPEWGRDDASWNAVIGAHNIAQRKGIAVDTDAYFDSIEKTLEIKLPGETKLEPEVDGEDPTEQAAQVVQRRTAPPAAPVTRSGDGAGGKTIVRLTADQREAAAASGLTDREYAENLVALKKEGAIH